MSGCGGEAEVTVKRSCPQCLLDLALGPGLSTPAVEVIILQMLTLQKTQWGPSGANVHRGGVYKSWGMSPDSSTQLQRRQIADTAPYLLSL